MGRSGDGVCDQPRVKARDPDQGEYALEVRRLAVDRHLLPGAALPDEPTPTDASAILYKTLVGRPRTCKQNVRHSASMEKKKRTGDQRSEEF